MFLASSRSILQQTTTVYGYISGWVTLNATTIPIQTQQLQTSNSPLPFLQPRVASKFQWLARRKYFGSAGSWWTGHPLCLGTSDVGWWKMQVYMFSWAGPNPARFSSTTAILPFTSTIWYTIYTMYIYIYYMYTIVCCKRTAKDPILFPWTGIGSLQPRGSPKEYLVEIKCQACMRHIIQDYSYPGLFWGQSKVWTFDISKAPVQGPSRTNPWLWRDLLQGRCRLRGISMKAKRHQTRFCFDCGVGSHLMHTCASFGESAESIPFSERCWGWRLVNKVPNRFN